MSFLETIERALSFLQRHGRVSLRALQREFELDDEMLEELVEELVDIQGTATRDGRALAWAGSGDRAAAAASVVETRERSPADYTPKHLAEKILQSKSALEGERKQVTVMFADVKGSMELAEEVGAERWHDILDRFFGILTAGVHRFEGSVNQYTGDGIMALFGAPIAHEDHAQRACYAALHLRDELRSYADELRRTEGMSLSARIGLNSGEVVVGKIGDDLRMDYTAQGHTVGLAQRMEARAAADSTYLTEHTARLVAGYFGLRDLGEFDLKGTSEPLRVYELEGLGAARTRLDRSRARGFAKFVGRDREVASLDEALEEAIAGNGQVVGVVAEAGTGKSRLCAEFISRCRARGIQVSEAHCPAHGKTIPYLPLLEMLRNIFEIEDQDTDYEARRKITGELMLLDEKFHDMLPLLFEFLGVADPARPAPATSPERRQQQLFAFIRHLQQARSEREPTVVLLDDLHWIDPGSDEFMAHAVEAAQGHRTLMLVNFRPEYHADWMAKSYYRQIPLQPLGREAIGELLADLVGSDPSLADVPRRVYERTGGNPFFVEEVVQSLIENGSLEGTRGAYSLASTAQELEIPTTVQTVLAARIDRLPERDKQLLQTASVIEKEFSQSILQSVAELAEADLVASLAALVQGEFLLQKSLYPEPEYAFKHPLTQEVAYGSLLGGRRVKLHASVARAIEQADADRLDERAALLAYHWENAGEALVAAQWYARAAVDAGFDSPLEASRHWEKVWEILESEGSAEEAVLLRLRAASQLLQFGWRLGMTDERVDQIFAEGKALAIARGDARVRMRLHYALGLVYATSGRPKLAVPGLEEALAWADTTGDPELRWSVREVFEWTLWLLGDLDRALRMNDEQLVLAENNPSVGVEIVGFSSSNCYSHRGMMLADLGRFAEFPEYFLRCEELARNRGEKEIASWNELFWAGALTTAGDARGALTMSRRALESCERIGSAVASVGAYGVYGMALALNGETEAARDRLEQMLQMGREAKLGLYFEPQVLATLSEVHLVLGDAATARKLAEEALEAAQEGLRVGEIRAHLTRARVLLALDGGSAQREIESALESGTNLVRSTGARAYEPMILETRAALASALGDADAAAQLNTDALALFRELGATGHAERLASIHSNDVAAVRLGVPGRSEP